MARYSNMNQLQTEIDRRLSNVIEDLTNTIYTQLMFFIDEDIYKTYRPTLYKRTKGFRNDAWAGEWKNTAKRVAFTIFYNPSLLKEEGYSHIDKEDLAEILNREYKNNWEGWEWGRTKNGKDWDYPKPFFDDTLNWIKENWNRIVKDALKKHGFKVK